MSLIQLHFEKFLSYHQNLLNGKIINQQNDVPPVDQYTSVLHIESLNIPVKDVTIVAFNGQKYIPKAEVEHLINEYYKQSSQYLLSIDPPKCKSSLLNVLVNTYITLFDHVYFFMLTLDQHAVQWDKSIIFKYIEFQLDQMDRISIILLQSSYSPSDDQLHSWISKISDYSSMANPLLYVLFHWILESKTTQFQSMATIINSIPSNQDTKSLKSILKVVLSIEPSELPSFTQFNHFLTNPPTNHSDPLSRIKQVIDYKKEYTTTTLFNSLYNSILQLVFKNVINNYYKLIKINQEQCNHLLSILNHISNTSDKLFLFDSVKSQYLLQSLTHLPINSPSTVPYLNLLAALSYHTNLHSLLSNEVLVSNQFNLISMYDYVCNKQSLGELDILLVPPMIILLCNLHSTSDDEFVSIIIKYSLLPFTNQFKNTLYACLLKKTTMNNYKSILFHLVDTKTVDSISNNPVALLKLINHLFKYPIHLWSEYSDIIKVLLSLYYDTNAFNNLEITSLLYEIFNRCTTSWYLQTATSSTATTAIKHPGYIVSHAFLVFSTNNNHYTNILLDNLSDCYNQTCTTVYDPNIPATLTNAVQFVYYLYKSIPYCSGCIIKPRIPIEYLLEWNGNSTVSDYSIKLCQMSEFLDVPTIPESYTTEVTKVSECALKPIDALSSLNLSLFDGLTIVPFYIPLQIESNLLLKWICSLFKNSSMKSLSNNSVCNTLVDSLINLLHFHDNDSLVYSEDTELIFCILYHVLTINSTWYITSPLYQIHLANVKSTNDYYQYLCIGWGLKSLALIQSTITLQADLLQPFAGECPRMQYSEDSHAFYRLLHTQTTEDSDVQRYMSEVNNLIKTTRFCSGVNASKFVIHCLSWYVYHSTLSNDELTRIITIILLNQIQLASPLLLAATSKLTVNPISSQLYTSYSNSLSNEQDILLVQACILTSKTDDPLENQQQGALTSDVYINDGIQGNIDKHNVIYMHYLVYLGMNNMLPSVNMNTRSYLLYRIIPLMSIHLINKLNCIRLLMIDYNDVIDVYYKLQCVNRIAKMAINDEYTPLLTNISNYVMDINCNEMMQLLDNQEIGIYAVSEYLQLLLLQGYVDSTILFNSIANNNAVIIKMMNYCINECRGFTIKYNKSELMATFELIKYGIMILTMNSTGIIGESIMGIMDYLLYLYKIYCEQLHLIKHGDMSKEQLLIYRPENRWDVDMGYYHSDEKPYEYMMNELILSMEMMGGLIYKLKNTPENRILMHKLEWVQSAYLNKVRNLYEQ
eukprot:NODE_3_length_56144_cov_0.348184.p5 type:complete len:1265 gc:universal NODE_3_length_56144_cov_0.348184:15034-11240(-)